MIVSVVVLIVVIMLVLVVAFSMAIPVVLSMVMILRRLSSATEKKHSCCNQNCRTNPFHFLSLNWLVILGW